MASRRAAANPTPPPPCRADPDSWHINILHGHVAVSRQVRRAAALCQLRCAADSPAEYRHCAQLSGGQLDPRTIVAGQVISVRRERLDPERFLTGSLHQLRPSAGDYAEAGLEPPR